MQQVSLGRFVIRVPLGQQVQGISGLFETSITELCRRQPEHQIRVMLVEAGQCAFVMLYRLGVSPASDQFSGEVPRGIDAAG